MKVRSPIVLMLALLVLGACQKTVGTQAPLQVALVGGTSHVTKVYPTQQWQDTGAVMARGETYQITGEGNWSFGAICGIADANGSGNTPICDGGVGSVPGVSAAALVGRIGEAGTPFLVGTKKTVIADESGNLYLGTNAWDWLPGDNTGFIRVTVQLEGGPVVVQRPKPTPSPALAPLPPLEVIEPIVTDGPRIALIIGNSSYPSAPLANPANDAEVMATALRSVGFDVIHRTDVNQKQMKRALNLFGDKLEVAGREAVGLFYYAGHGVQVGGRNYMIPTDAAIEREQDVDVEGVAVDSILIAMELADNRLNFVVLDACRNNPFKRGFRSAARGLARMDAPRGSLIAYATGPGSVANDGTGKNSPYTEALARAIMKKGVSVERMFRLVRNSVMDVTGNAQVPWEASSLTGGDFFFNPQK